jgi:Mn-dependent DtxR family transcriptional regulator
MTDKQQLWTGATEAMQAIMPFYRQAMTQAIEKSGVANWFTLTLARGAAPEPFSALRFHGLYPYVSLQRQTDMLTELAKGAFLEAVGSDAYRITERGREILAGIYHPAYESMQAVAPLSPDEMKQLNDLLWRVVQAALNAPEPKDKLGITASRANDPGEGWGAIVKTDQYLTDLDSFRDDAHIAAWKPYGVSGKTWEALSFVWEGKARTAQELAEKLPFRAHTQEDYAQSLEELVRLGWIQPADGGYQITEKGRALRQEAEDSTNRYHLAAWDCLCDQEQAQLYDLLTWFRDKLEQLAETHEERTK